MTVACAFSEADGCRPPLPSLGCFPIPTPLYLLHQSLLSLLTSLSVGAVGSALAWGPPCAPQCVGCPAGAVLLDRTGRGVEGLLKIGLQGRHDGQRVKQQVAAGTLLFSNVTLCLQPSHQDGLLPWPPPLTVLASCWHSQCVIYADCLLSVVWLGIGLGFLLLVASSPELIAVAAY